jgi:beta-propeller repeat-containing protein
LPRDSLTAVFITQVYPDNLENTPISGLMHPICYRSQLGRTRGFMNKGFINNVVVCAPRSLNVSLALLISILWMGQSILSGFTIHADNSIPAKPSVNTDQAARLAEAYGKLPLSFEANRGQLDPHVKFISRGSGYALFLTSHEAVLSLSRGAEENTSRQIGPDSGELGRAAASQRISTVLRMKLAGSNPLARVAGDDELRGKSNYFIGNDPKQWRAGVQNFAKVRYEGVYPGVDMIYYGNQRELEYDFVVAAGADPGRIRLSFEGAQSISVDSQGDLVLSAEGGEIRQRKPVIYQEVDGTMKSTDGGVQATPVWGTPFPVNALAIDPESPSIIYSAMAGFGVYKSTDGGQSWSDASRGLSSQTVNSLVIDPQNPSTIYVGTNIGISKSTDRGRSWSPINNGLTTSFVRVVALAPTNPSTLYAGTNIASDAFITRINATGSMIAYSTYLGGSDSDVGYGIALDPAGSMYVTGKTASLDYPTVKAMQATHGGGRTSRIDAFVTKINPAGTALTYSTYLGGSSDDNAYGIAVNSAGNAYVAGWTASTNFPVTSHIQSSLGGVSTNAFVTKLNTKGTGLAYSTYLGGNDGFSQGNAIAVDLSSNPYIAGEVFSANFPTTPAGFQASTGGSADAFIVKIEDTSFDICIQDENNSSFLQINSTTGEYKLTTCDGFTLGGTAGLTIKGCTIAVQDKRADRQVTAKIDTCSKKATASIQVFSIGRTFAITDRNTADNSCSCAAGRDK